MPLNLNLKKVLVIGSGPIVIGQAAEFDYAGTQACRALREEGLEIVLINSNPATIMTDAGMADKIYIEPLTLETVKRVIRKEKPDSVLSTLGGQTGLTLSMQLAKEGFLERHGVKLLGAKPETIDRAEDRQIFKDTMESINQPCIPSVVVTDVEEAVAFANDIGYPVIVRPAFTLGGSGGGSCADEAELREICAGGLRLSPITQCLIEKSIAGWKEIEFEVVRDASGSAIAVCSMENLDPVGVHTGDSIVVAPCVTLAKREFDMMRQASLDIVHSLEVEGGCNVQLALHPTSYEYAVIEVNPRVSRSSALASKATGFPIAKVATKIAVGYHLHEIANAVTGKTMACFEPTLDYVALKFPKWPFDKFVYASRTLGTQMKATGEVMSLGVDFEDALRKAVRGAEIGRNDLFTPAWFDMPTEQLLKNIATPTDERLFQVFELLRRGVSVDDIHDITWIDRWFLWKLEAMSQTETPPVGQRIFRTVDTCAGEFDTATPYLYSVPSGEEDEAAKFIAQGSGKEKVVVLGSGPIRIGQGIEFDYASVHCVQALRKLGYETVIINNNPETVSTDFDTADRLYFDPLTADDVDAILKLEKPMGVVCAFGGQTAIKLAKFLHENNYPMLGTQFEGIDRAEDRDRFDELLEKVQVKRPAGETVMTMEEAITVGNKLGYPVLVRPSYVLGGQNMAIANNDDEMRQFMQIILDGGVENPVLVDKYLMGFELEVDAICDGEEILIPGIMEHIERTGVHSGDSIAVYPAIHIDDDMIEEIVGATKRISAELDIKGIVNIQYLIWEGELYVIEVNPRASRTVPYISKVTGVPVAELCTRCMLGEKLVDMGFGTGLCKTAPYYAVKVPVFSFQKLHGVDTQLGPEMKSTGEALGIGKTLEEALYKGLLAAGFKMHTKGGVLITVRKQDKSEIPAIAKKFADLGFKLYATEGNAQVLREAGLQVEAVPKIQDNPEHNTATLIDSGKVQYVVSTSAKGRDPERASVQIRLLCSKLGVPCLTSIDTANALAESLQSRYSEINTELVDINAMRAERQTLRFTKLQTCGNGYLYFNCFDQHVGSPESLAIALCNRDYGVGADGIVLIMQSKIADAKMRMFNLDGSEGQACGNGLRCVAKHLYDSGIAKKRQLTIETSTGVVNVCVRTVEDSVTGATVDMGTPNCVGESITVQGEQFDIARVNMGNMYCVLFPSEQLEGYDVQRVGELLENALEYFPDRTNVAFAQLANEGTINLRVWERGQGETLSCGTGACAAVVAAVDAGLLAKDRDISVKLPGGEQVVCVGDDGVTLSGDAKKVFDGTLQI
ncbi:MAG: carbamoyl-phosphate synthase large subunit [Oscillospiraceae bacterium]|nr:carbamoyl-phosphate synthase large subunit [Oscillospiraceae bacterium]